MNYNMKRSEKSTKRIVKYATHLLQLERCAQKEIRETLRTTLCHLLDECTEHMVGLNGIELSLIMKQSIFPDVRENAERLMDACTSKLVISNGTE